MCLRVPLFLERRPTRLATTIHLSTRLPRIGLSLQFGIFPYTLNRPVYLLLLTPLRRTVTFLAFQFATHPIVTNPISIVAYPVTHEPLGKTVRYLLGTLLRASALANIRLEHSIVLKACAQTNHLGIFSCKLTCL